MKTSGRRVAMNPALQTLVLMGVVSLLTWTARSADSIELFVLQKPVLEPWWQLPVSVYAHADPSHLFSNATVVLFAGGIISLASTWLRFHVFFIVTGAVSGISQVYLTGVLGNSVAVLGASGAAFALVGYLATSNPASAKLFERSRNRTLAAAVIGIALVLTLFVAGVDVANVAHFIGILMGAVAGYFNLLQQGRFVPLPS